MIYFDVTDVVHFATRHNRLTGVQRVQVNIVGLLARKHGAAAVRCSFLDAGKQTLLEFDPLGIFDSREFDADSFFAALGGNGGNDGSGRFPSKAHIKSYLRRYQNNKLLRTIKKLDVYVSALLSPKRLERMGLSNRPRPASAQAVVLSPLASLPLDSTLVCMGAMWLHPDVCAIAQAHRERGGDVVQMVYDLIPILYPRYFSDQESRAFDTWLKSALRYASRFISISNYTGNDLRKYAQALGHAPVIRTIPLAHEFMGYERFAAVEPSPQLSGLISSKYVVCVGTIEHRKNTVALLKVWGELKTELGDRMPLLVFAGKFGSGSADFQKHLNNHPDLTPLVRVMHSPSDHDLAWLYSHAQFTALPSLIEGWGLPVGEGAWFGKFCVASNATSVPEVCGELMDYVDPTNNDSIKDGIRRAIVDTDYLAKREAAIRSATMRGWADVADDIYDYVTTGATNDRSSLPTQQTA